MPQDFNIPDSLSYKRPETVIDGDSNFVEFQPVAGSTFTQDQSLKIRVNSADEFLDVRRSYLKYDLALTGGATTAGNMISELGGASVLRRITTTISGSQIEDFDDYNLSLSVKYAQLPETNKNFLKQVEFYNNQTVLTSSASAYSNGRTCCHALRTALFECDRVFPLAFVRSGIELDIVLAPVNDLIIGDSDTTGYQISNVRFVACMIKPTQSYMKSFQSTLESGNTAHIPLHITRNVKLAPTTTTDQTNIMNIGFYKSLRSFFGVFRESTSINSATTDSFKLNSLNGLKQYSVRVGSNKYPRNFDIGTTYSITSATVRPEFLMQSLVSMDNSYAHFNAVDPTSNTNNYIYYNWASNESPGSGIATEDGSITLNHIYHTAPGGTETYSFFFLIDGVLKISAVDCSLDVRNY